VKVNETGGAASLFKSVIVFKNLFSVASPLAVFRSAARNTLQLIARLSSQCPSVVSYRNDATRRAGSSHRTGDVRQTRHSL